MQENDKDALPEKEADRPVIHIDNFDGPLDLLWA